MPASSHQRKAVEFYSIQLSQLADGAMFVEIVAISINDREPELLSQELISERVASIDAALTLVKMSIII